MDSLDIHSAVLVWVQELVFNYLFVFTLLLRKALNKAIAAVKA
jgi:hypothetical protein